VGLWLLVLALVDHVVLEVRVVGVVELHVLVGGSVGVEGLLGQRLRLRLLLLVHECLKIHHGLIFNLYFRRGGASSLSIFRKLILLFNAIPSRIEKLIAGSNQNGWILW